MRATVQAKDLADAVAWLGKVVRRTSSDAHGSRDLTQVQSAVHLTAEDGRLVLQATDLDVWATAEVEATVDTPGTAILHAKLVTEVAGRLRKAPVTLELEGTALTLTCGAMVLHARTMNVAWPQFPAVPTEIGRVKAEALRDAVARVAPGVGEPEADPPFRSISADTADTLTLAATDRRRLAVARVALEPVLGYTGDAGVLLPATLVAVAQGLPKSGDASLHLDPVSTATQGARRFGLSWPGRSVSAGTVMGVAAPYARTLAIAKPVLTAAVDRAELVDAIRRVVPAAERDKVKAIRMDLTFTPGELELTGASAAGEAREAVEAEYDGPEIPLHLNAQYLLDALEATGGERVHIGLAKTDTDPRKHATLMITNPQDPNYMHVVTLIRQAVALARKAA
ncbi:DNA polymerase III subunit beta [Parafrankia sp. FMc2]|uniref:DNA polymerase III subunit beta n=1 Tax=Parafrankia sp. FMc2 TaxID=3233196 RepID=UPI0034D6905B